MSSVTAGESNWAPIEFGRRRQATADLCRLSIAAQYQQQSERSEPSPVLVGRAPELGIIRTLLDDVVHGGGALVLSGEQGIGKTALLDAAERAASARGMRVVRVDGAEFEAEIDLAGLHQLLVALSGEISELPNRTRCAIESALDLVVGHTPDRLVVMNAVFALLRHAAGRTPMMLIVDDVHWFDRASAEALAFVARRLAGSRVGLLAAARVGSESLLTRVGLPEMRLRPLTNNATPNKRRRIPTLNPVDGRAAADGREPCAVNEFGASLTIAPRVEPAASGQRTLTLARRLGSAPELMTDACHADLDLRAATVKGAGLLYSCGEVDAAHDVLVDAIDSAWGRPDHDIPGLVEALHTLSVACYFGGRAELWVPFQRTLDLMGDAAPPVLRLIGQTCPDPLAASATVLLEVDHHVDQLRTGQLGPAQAVHIGMAAHVVDRLTGCRKALRRLFFGGRDKGASDCVVRAGLLLAIDAVDAGRWVEAETLAEECIGLCETSGLELLAWSGRSVLALAAAGRGHWNVCRALTTDMIEWATPRGVVALIRDAHHARCLAALGRGDQQDALPDVGGVARQGAVRTDDSPVPRYSLDLVAVAVRTRQHAAATARAAELSGAGIARLSPRLALQVAGAQALVAPDELAADLFQAALDIPGIGQWPFEVARVQLAFGERLRRRQATRASREQLAAALDTFTRLGARPWAERASAELRATGQTRHRPDGKSPVPLTPQELGIAELAATGLTNKQIGAKMYLSPRTVSAHLYRVFPKLGITSRAALRDALLALPTPR